MGVEAPEGKANEKGWHILTAGSRSNNLPPVSQGIPDEKNKGY